jgi:hypothetical protein
MKRVSVVLSGAVGGDVRDIDLMPATTPRDVLQMIGLGNQQYLVSLEGSAEAFAAEEQIYARVPDGGKLRLTPVSDVGR